MSKLEAICKQVFNSHQATIKLLFGGLLCSIPILNFFALGYLYNYLEQIRRNQSLELPDWDQWGTLFLQGVRFLLALLVYFLIPVGVVWLLSSVLNAVFSGQLGGMVYLPLQLILLMLPAVFVSALLEYNLSGEIESLLRFKRILSRPLCVLPSLIIPSFAFLGLLWLGFPVLTGFTFFLGFCIAIPYCTFSYLTITKK